MERRTGRYKKYSYTSETVAAFIPYPLPPRNPPLTLDEPLRDMLRKAESNLAQLEQAGKMVPSLEWFIYGFVRKEAVISSQIEGTQASLIDLLTFEATDRAGETLKADVEEVCNYVDALKYALDELRRKRGLPLSMRLLKKTHTRLMRGVRGADKKPGEVRRSQNWIGGTRPGNAVYVPPPPQELADLLGSLEKYIHAKDALPPLVRAGLLHAQFETIHPFLDGNGRLGRLLITLLLEHWGLLSQPLLYLSLFFKRHQAEYYRRLGLIRTEGDWELWMSYFLEGVAVIAQEAAVTAHDLFNLVSQDRVNLLSRTDSTVMCLRLFEQLPVRPVFTAANIVEQLETTKPTAMKAIHLLLKAGVLSEITGKKRDQTFAYSAYLDRLRIEKDAR
jgi:cell filamentation protein, protein adenylyltransferase